MTDVEFGPVPSNAGSGWRAGAAAGAALVAIAFAGSSCSMIDQFNPFGGEKYKMEITPDIPASKTYDQGLQKLANGAPAEAAKKFTDLGKQYPSSDWAQKGLLMTTYADYQAGDYTSAVTSAERYLKDYPNSPDARLRALSAGERILHADTGYIARPGERGEGAGRRSRRWCRNTRSPNMSKTRSTRSTVTEDQLAGKEMSIGRFYLNRRNYTAAINRFRNVLQYYQTTRHAEEALYRLVEAYLGLGITDEAQTAAAVLGHNFPDSQWYQDAYDLLKGKGLSPHEYRRIVDLEDLAHGRSVLIGLVHAFAPLHSRRGADRSVGSRILARADDPHRRDRRGEIDSSRCAGAGARRARRRRPRAPRPGAGPGDGDLRPAAGPRRPRAARRAGHRDRRRTDPAPGPAR